MVEMPSIDSRTKDVLLASRVTRRISDLVRTMADKEGLHVSEWIRLLIVNELNRERTKSHNIDIILPV